MISSLKLQNIRCFSDQTFEFSPNVNLLIGSNGSGKTTILESIGFFSSGRFQSVPQDALAISSGQEIGRIEVQIKIKQKEITSSVAIMAGAKVAMIAGKKVPNSAVIGLQRAVYFSPEAIDLVSGPPSIRRRELDLIIAQKERKYVLELLEYRRILHQRNELMRQIVSRNASRDQLDFWDKRLVKSGLNIFKKRQKLLEKINESIQKVHAYLIGNESALSLKYVPSVDYSRYSEALVGILESDLRYGNTSLGPHRDDFVFQEKNFSLKDGASRGEQRVAAAAFKALSKDYLMGDSSPILIIDDIFSELDDKRREAIMHILDGGQTFISATDEKVVPEELKKKANIIKLNSE